MAEAEYTQEDLQRMAFEQETEERKKLFDFHWMYLQKFDKLTDSERKCFVRFIKKMWAPPIIQI